MLGAIALIGLLATVASARGQELEVPAELDEELPAEAIDPSLRDAWRNQLDSRRLAALMEVRGFEAPSDFEALVIAIEFDADRTTILREAAFDFGGLSGETRSWVPASTVKLFAAVAGLQRVRDLGFSSRVRVQYVDTAQRETTVRRLVEDAIVDSDNIAYNRLVQLVGYDRLNVEFLSVANGIERSAITSAYERSVWVDELGEDSSLKPSPALSLREGDHHEVIAATRGTVKNGCSRAACVSLQDLASVMRRLMLQEQLAERDGYGLPKDELLFLRRLLRQERERGDRVVDRLREAFGRDEVTLYHKPGYASEFASDVIYVHHAEQRRAWVIALYVYPGRTSVDQAAELLGELLATGALNEPETLASQ